MGIADLDDLTPNYREKSINELQRETEKFYNAVKTGKLPSLTLTDLIGFWVWKINARNLKSEFPADHAYWEEHGLFEKNYYYDANINPFRLLLARIIEPIIHFYLQRIFKGYS